MVRKGKLIPAIYGSKRLIVEKLSLEKISLFCVDRLENYVQQKLGLVLRIQTGSLSFINLWLQGLFTPLASKDF